MREKTFGPILFLLIGVYALFGLLLLRSGVALDASKCAAPPSQTPVTTA